MVCKCVFLEDLAWLRWLHGLSRISMVCKCMFMEVHGSSYLVIPAKMAPWPVKILHGVLMCVLGRSCLAQMAPWLVTVCKCMFMEILLSQDESASTALSSCNWLLHWITALLLSLHCDCFEFCRLPINTWHDFTISIPLLLLYHFQHQLCMHLEVK